MLILRNLISAALILLSLPIFTHENWVHSQKIRQYINDNYPHIEFSLQNKTYSKLASLDGRLLLGRDLKAYSDNTSFSQGILMGAYWRGRHFEQPRFDFSFADISFADFARGDLRKCNFTNSKAFNADFSFAVFTCENIKGADFSEADLTKTRIIVKGREYYITKAKLQYCGALFDKFTKIRNPLTFKYRTKREWELLLRESDFAAFAN